MIAQDDFLVWVRNAVGVFMAAFSWWQVEVCEWWVLLSLYIGSMRTSKRCKFGHFICLLCFHFLETIHIKNMETKNSQKNIEKSYETDDNYQLNNINLGFGYNRTSIIATLLNCLISTSLNLWTAFILWNCIWLPKWLWHFIGTWRISWLNLLINFIFTNESLISSTILIDPLI